MTHEEREVTEKVYMQTTGGSVKSVIREMPECVITISLVTVYFAIATTALHNYTQQARSLST